MNPIEIERQIALELNLAEQEAASVAARLARIDYLANEPFSANYGASQIAKAEARGAAAQKSVANLKTRLSALHGAFVAVANSATFPRPRTGK
jgi:hypothetical protein